MRIKYEKTWVEKGEWKMEYSSWNAFCTEAPFLMFHEIVQHDRYLNKAKQCAYSFV